MFILNDDEWELLQDINGHTIYLGEVSGKHSEVQFDFDIADIEILSENEEEIKIVQRLLGNSVGFGWRHYIIEGFLDRLYEEVWEAVENDEEIEEFLENNVYSENIAEKVKVYWVECEKEQREFTE